MTEPRPPLLALDAAGLTRALGGPGRARAVHRIVAAGQDPFASLEPGPLARLTDACRPTVAERVAHATALDGTEKLLLRLADGAAVETVVIPIRDRTTLCVSSQVGCARGCTFCLTATMGLVRNLSCDEIVAQVVAGIRAASQSGLPAVRNVVYMGMGEPLDNLDAVRDSLQILTDDRVFGLGPRHVTVSTVGTTEGGIAALLKLPCHAAWSLHAADDEKRAGLIANTRRSVAALYAAFLAGLAPTARPLFVECALMDGVNDGADDAAAIISLLRDAPVEVRVNLLPMNPIGSGALRPSPPARVEAFRDQLLAAGLRTIIRRARGQEARAACGQLAVLR